MHFSHRFRCHKLIKTFVRRYGSQELKEEKIIVNKTSFIIDDYTNITPKILHFLGKNVHNKQNHPLSFVKQKIANYFYTRFKGRNGNPLFSIYDNLDPVVTIEQNFDSLLIPKDHISRKKSDCFYLNR